MDRVEQYRWAEDLAARSYGYHGARVERADGPRSRLEGPTARFIRSRPDLYVELPGVNDGALIEVKIESARPGRWSCEARQFITNWNLSLLDIDVRYALMPRSRHERERNVQAGWTPFYAPSLHRLRVYELFLTSTGHSRRFMQSYGLRMDDDTFQHKGLVAPIRHLRSTRGSGEPFFAVGLA